MPFNRLLVNDPFTFAKQEEKAEFAKTLHEMVEKDWGGDRITRSIKSRHIVFRLPKLEQFMDFIQMRSTGVTYEDGDEEVLVTFFAPSIKKAKPREGIGLVPRYTHEFLYKYCAAVDRAKRR